MELLTRRSVIEPTPLPDVYGKIANLELLPGGYVRCWVCQDRGARLWAVSRIVLSGWDLVTMRPTIGRWLAANGFHEGPPLIIH